MAVGSLLRACIPLHQGKPQPPCINLDLHQHYCWYKSALIHAGTSSQGRGSGFGGCCCCQTCPLPGLTHPPISTLFHPSLLHSNPCSGLNFCSGPLSLHQCTPEGSGHLRGMPAPCTATKHFTVPLQALTSASLD